MRPVLMAVGSTAVAVLASPTMLSPAQAVPSGQAAWFTVQTTFEDPPEPDVFTSSIEGCTSGTVVDADADAAFTPWGGVFRGVKEFTCSGEESGFSVRLVARFGAGGSEGSWTVVSGWGGLSGLKGSGKLVGTPIQDGIEDHYVGTLR
jgi:hypothetical protein